MDLIWPQSTNLDIFYMLWKVVFDCFNPVNELILYGRSQIKTVEQAWLWNHPCSKVRTFWEAHKIWKNLPHSFLHVMKSSFWFFQSCEWVDTIWSISNQNWPPSSPFCDCIRHGYSLKKTVEEFIFIHSFF